MWLDLRQAGELPATNLCWNYTVLTMSDSHLKAVGRARHACPSLTDLAGPDSPGGPGPVPEAVDGPVRLKTLRQTRVKRLIFLPSQCNRGRWDLGLQPGRGYLMGAGDAEWDGDVSLRQRHQHR